MSELSYRDWNEEDYHRFIEDMIDFMRGCRAERCEFHDDEGCTLQHIDMSYAATVSDWRALDDMSPKSYMKRPWRTCASFLSIECGDEESFQPHHQDGTWCGYGCQHKGQGER